MKPRIPGNVLASIEARRYGVYSRSMKSTYRYNNRIMKNLVASPDRLFKRVMKVRSSRSIAFECPSKLYAENNRDCYELRGPRGEPVLLYSIDAHSHPGKWRYDAHVSITRSGLTNPNPPRCDLRLLLTSKSFLEVREENTGRMIDFINLNSTDSPGVKFKALNQDENLDQVIATSTKLKDPSNILRYFIILEVCPIVRKALRVPIRKDVFGQDIMDVGLSDGILKVVHRKEVVKLYDFDLLRRANRVVDGANDKVLLIEHVGEPLYVVNGSNEMLELGGCPFHYIACSQRRHEYSVRTIDHRKLATFPMNENDTVAFHQDDSGMITHSQKGGVSFYKLIYDENTQTELLKKVKDITIVNSNRKDEQEKTRLHGYAMPERRSPRMIGQARRSFAEEEEQVLFCDDFENELHLNLLMGTDADDPHKRGVIQLFDNETGTHIKTMKFSRQLSDRTEYLAILDLDVLMVFAAKDGGTSGEARVYRLLHREAWGDECPSELYDLPGTAVRRRSDIDLDFVLR